MLHYIKSGMALKLNEQTYYLVWRLKLTLTTLHAVFITDLKESLEFNTIPKYLWQPTTRSFFLQICKH